MKRPQGRGQVNAAVGGSPRRPAIEAEFPADGLERKRAVPICRGQANGRERLMFKGLTRSLVIVAGLIVVLPYAMMMAVQ